MRSFPDALHHGWPVVDFNQQTTFPRLCAGECEIPVPRREPAGREFAVSCITVDFSPDPRDEVCQNLPPPRATDISKPSVSARKEMISGLVNNQGAENPFRLWRELGRVNDAGIAPSSLQQNLQRGRCQKSSILLERMKSVNLSDRSAVGEHERGVHRQLLQHDGNCAGGSPGAALRDESRGRTLQTGFFQSATTRTGLKTTKASSLRCGRAEIPV